MFTKAKVREFNMAIIPDKQIVWFQITMNIVQSVNTLHCKDSLSDIEPGFFFG
jgi:hypothetical protein